MLPSALYIVATPIGNLGDMTFRAVEILKQVDLIAAEDTRQTQKLLQLYQIKNKLISLHEHNEKQATQKILACLAAKQAVALVSDAGTPLISDPGESVVAAVWQTGGRVIPIPGPCAAITALSAAGLATSEFSFVGFLPAKGAQRKKMLANLQQETRTLIFYEAPHRIRDFLELASENFGQERMAVLARELTKQFETIRRAPLKELMAFVAQDENQTKGEFVVLIAGNSAIEKNTLPTKTPQEILQLMLQELPLKQAVALTAQITNAKKNELYALALDISIS